MKTWAKQRKRNGFTFLNQREVWGGEKWEVGREQTGRSAWAPGIWAVRDEGLRKVLGDPLWSGRGCQPQF